MKKFLVVLLAGMLAMPLIACGGDGEDDGITVWVHAQGVKTRLEGYAEASGNQINVVMIPVEDFQVKLKQSVLDPKAAPDLFVIAKDYAREWVEVDGAVANLSAEFPEDISAYQANTYDSLFVIGTHDGDAYGVTSEYTPGMMFYNRRLANELFGTDDDVEVGRLIASEQQILELNDRLQEMYGGSVKMFGTFLNVSAMYFNARVDPWVVDNVMKITPEIEAFFDWSKTVWENDMVMAVGEEDSYFNSTAQGTHLLDPLPTWGFLSKIRPQIADPGTELYGVTTPYLTYTRGGSYWFIPEVSTKKAETWEAIKYLLMDEDVLTQYCLDNLALTSNRHVTNALAESDHREPLMGNQQIFKTYHEEIPTIEAKFGDSINVTRYDGTISEHLRAVAVDYGTGKVTLDQAYNDFKTRIESAYQELTVELP